MPDDPGTDTGTAKDLENAVNDRVAIEEGMYPDSGLNNGRISSAYISMCLQSGELGSLLASGRQTRTKGVSFLFWSMLRLISSTPMAR